MYEFLKVPRELWPKADELWTHHYGEEHPVMVVGARDTLFQLDRRGYRMGVVTSGSQRRIHREISQLGLASLFRVVVCNEDIVNKKPHPEGLIKALTTLDIASHRVCYVGDAPEDVLMGKNAQVLTVGVRSSYPSSKLLSQVGPDINLEEIADLLLHFL
jgi:HAD superfamily hydrolase (TIGR01509 family)